MTDSNTDSSQNSGFNFNVGPIEATAGILSVGLFSVAIGLFNHFNNRKDFKESITKKTQNFYQATLEAGAKKLGKPVDELTEEEKHKITDSDAVREQLFSLKNGVVKDKENYKKATKNGWTVSGMITGFGMGSLIAGLLLTSIIGGPLAILAGVAIGAVLAAGTGFLANKAAGAYAERDGTKLLLSAAHRPKNQEGIDREREAKETEKDNKFITKVKQRSEAKTQKTEQKRQKKSFKEHAERPKHNELGRN